jgi:RNA polymerase sigma factor (sigma-70 family)
MIDPVKLAECISLCIKRRRLHYAIRTLGFEIEDFVHEVVVRTFLKNKNYMENKYAYGTISDKQINWALYDLIRRQVKHANKELTNIPAPSDDKKLEVKDQVAFILSLKILTQQEKQILKTRFVDGLSLRESAKLYPVCHEKIRRIETVAINKLKKFYGIEIGNC